MADTAKVRLREYETIYLLKSDLTDDGVDKVKERVRGVINRENGKALRFTTWGKKKTQYPIAKQPRAIYVHASYLGDSKLVAEVERNLRILEEVVRYLSVKIAEDVDPESRPVLEDVKMAGDVDEVRPGATGEREGAPMGGRTERAAPEAEEPAADEEAQEEA